MKQTESTSVTIKGVGAIAKLVGKDPKSTMIGILCVFSSVFLYGWIKAEKRKDEMVDTYNVLIFSLVRQTEKIEQAVETIKVRKEVEDSLQNKQ